MKALAIALVSTALSASILMSPAFAQVQQAGSAAGKDTEGTFQALIDQCDDVDALMLRARIRLQLPRTTPEAAETAQKMLEEGFATCGGGDLEGAKATLTEALIIAEAGATENFGTDAAVESAEEAKTASANTSLDNQSDDDVSDAKPWWKFW